ncbi:MAG: hypothetical protein HYY02_13850 [Chloroflexi bacterium]|nr:hypothetical protein [Chloroflexota bacterium]
MTPGVVKARLLASPIPLVVGFWPIFAIVHLVGVGLAAGFLGLVARWEALQALLVAGPWDDIHTRLAIEMVGGVEAYRFVLRGPFEGALSDAFPAVLAPPDLLPQHLWSGLVFAAGTSTISVQLAEVLANSGMILLGTAAILVFTLSQDGLPPFFSSRLPLAAAWGMLVYGLVAQFHVSWQDDSGGQAMLSMLATKGLGIESAAYDSVVDAGPAFSLVLNILVTVFAIGVGVVGVWLVQVIQTRRRRASLPLRPSLVYGARRVGLMMPGCLAVGALLFQTLFTPGIVFEPGSSYERRLMTAMTAPQAASKPTVVTIVAGTNGFEYSVNGKRRSIRCIGYNAMTLDEDPEERKQHINRDFTAIRAYGANTVVGWNQLEFDAVLLEMAATRNLGVILPFELDSDWDYSNAQMKQRLMQRIRRWVEQYKASPALRMWGLGNEVVHGIVDTANPRAQAFAAFLVEAADYVHRLDPDHPVLYRDAEDVYLEPVAKALAEDGVPRPWFVYGMNFFTERMQDALREGPSRLLKQPLLISEFGPVGLHQAQRPDGYGRLWRIIRGFPNRVLGGCAYVWSMAGPEPLDLSFGMTDERGEPVDETIFALAALYLKEQAQDQ